MVQVGLGMNYYDFRRGWEGTLPGWHEVTLHYEDPRVVLLRFEETVNWIQCKIGKWEKHCRWHFNGNYLHYKFRYERDALWFRLTWG